MADLAFAGDVARAKALLTKYGAWINKYRGGMPAGWMAAIMLHESGGNFGAAGDARLGEVGYYQIAEYVPALFGLPASARLDPESNVAIAALEYALEAIMWRLAFPDVVRLGTGDSWRLARLAFAVGRGGSHQLARAAQAAGGLRAGDVYGSIVDYVKANGGMPLGSQSASKVADRVMNIARQWAIGEAVGGGAVGPPMYIPDPPAGKYAVPLVAQGFFVKPLPALAFALFGGLALMVYLWRNRR